ncbi:MAG: redoxin domain-containing protein [Stappiaceae bacterium]
MRGISTSPRSVISLTTLIAERRPQKSETTRLQVAQADEDDHSGHDHPPGQHDAHEQEEDHSGHNHGPGEHGLDLSSSMVNNVSELSTRLIAGVNTAPSDLRSLLKPGTIVHFWASWCAPCEAEIPGLDKFYRTQIQNELGSKGIRLVTISNDRVPAGATRFIEKHKLNFPVYYDAKQLSNAAIVGQRSLPSTVIVDRNGELQRLSLGQLDWSYPKLPDLLISTVSRGSVAENGPKNSKNPMISQKKEQ